MITSGSLDEKPTVFFMFRYTAVPRTSSVSSLTP
jgi:hypothetical protein